MFEGMPFHYIDMPAQENESNQDGQGDPRLRRGSEIRAHLYPNSSWVTDSSDDDSSSSNAESIDFIFSDLSALVDLTRFDCSDSEMCRILEEMIE
jgi:hypothetical protein